MKSYLPAVRDAIIADRQSSREAVRPGFTPSTIRLMPRRTALMDAKSLTPPQIRTIRRRLLGWFDCVKRDLPWRSTGDPYRIWLSETMLQQTQVATVIPYYERFLDRFPTVQALAAAPLDDVLRLWAGLGYYARARNLHRAANEVVNRCGGAFPSTEDALRELPGVGAYTAGAVASIAFGRRSAVVDGNVARVLSRVDQIELDVRGGAGRDLAWAAARQLVPADRPGDFNQALMELGATVCLPGEAARCLTCPIQRQCRAFVTGTVASYPVRRANTPTICETHVVAAIVADGKWLFVRRPDKGLWGGLWELPTSTLPIKAAAPKVQASPVADSAVVSAMLARAWAADPVDVEALPFCDLTHQLTHRTIRFVGHVCRVRRAGAGARRKSARSNSAPTAAASADHAVTPHQWLSLDEGGTLGISTGMKHVIAALLQRVPDRPRGARVG